MWQNYYCARAFALYYMVATVFATPMVDPPPECSPPVATYTTYTQGAVNGAESMGALHGPNITLGLEEEYSVSVTVSVGADLGIDTDAASVGLDMSVDWTTEEATTDSGQATCPTGGWTCGMLIIPSVYQVTGYISWTKPQEVCGSFDTYQDGDYTIRYPIQDGEGRPVTWMGPCACPDYVSWADPGAPVLCPYPCMEA